MNGINDATEEQWTSLGKMSKLCATQPLPVRSPDAPPEPKATDTQVGGDHYSKHTIQPIDYIMGNKLGFCEGNVVKYITRYRDKGSLKDLEKARQYIDFLIEEVNVYKNSEKLYEKENGIY